MASTAADFSRPWDIFRREHARLLRSRIASLARRLEAKYHTPDLGNVSDPVDEAIYILLTYQTDLPRAQEAWRRLKARFVSWENLLEASESDLADLLRPSGLHRTRARLIRALLHAIKVRFGALSLESLRTLPAEKSEAELRVLPGIDLKGARCVLLYSFGRQVFPVDSNTFRFMRRYGVLGESARYRRRATHDGLQAIVPPRLRYSLHVNLVVHGQRTCVPRIPRCPVCPVKRTCATGRRAA